MVLQLLQYHLFACLPTSLFPCGDLSFVILQILCGSIHLMWSLQYLLQTPTQILAVCQNLLECPRFWFCLSKSSLLETSWFFLNETTCIEVILWPATSKVGPVFNRRRWGSECKGPCIITLDTVWWWVANGKSWHHLGGRGSEIGGKEKNSASSRKRTRLPITFVSQLSLIGSEQHVLVDKWRFIVSWNVKFVFYTVFSYWNFKTYAC